MKTNQNTLKTMKEMTRTIAIALLVLVIFASCASKPETLNRHESGDYWATMIPDVTAGDEKEGLTTYVLTIGRTDGQDLLKQGNQQQQAGLLHYFSFQVQHDLLLRQGDVQIPAAFCHLERSFGLMPHRNIIVAFDDSTWDPHQPYEVILDTSELIQEPITFSISKTTDG